MISKIRRENQHPGAAVLLDDAIHLASTEASMNGDISGHTLRKIYAAGVVDALFHAGYDDDDILRAWPELTQELEDKQ